MTDTTTGNSKPRSVVRTVVRWLLVIIIFYFLGARLIRDWPSVRDAVGRISWGWIAVGIVPGFLYFIPRVASWQSLLRNLGVRTRFWQAGKVWVNGEIVRYIPGNVWSVLGRVAQAGAISTTKTIVFSSMALEAMMLVSASAMLSALLLIGYPALTFPLRTILLVVSASAMLLVTHRRVAQWFVNVVFRVLKRKDLAPSVSGTASAFGWMVLSWIFFVLFQLIIIISLGFTVTFGSSIALMGALMLSWLLGYISFITPSGLGVREAATVLLLRPFMGTPEAILVAVVSRVFIILIEVVGLGIVNVIALNSKNNESLGGYGTE